MSYMRNYHAYFTRLLTCDRTQRKDIDILSVISLRLRFAIFRYFVIQRTTDAHGRTE